MGDKNPGVGQYNIRTHLVKRDLKVDPNNFKFWIKKHREPSPLKNPHLKPAVGLYNPIPVMYNTF